MAPPVGQRLNRPRTPLARPVSHLAAPTGPDRSVPHPGRQVVSLGLFSSQGVTTLLPYCTYPFRLSRCFMRFFRLYVHQSSASWLGFVSSHPFYIAHERIPSAHRCDGVLVEWAPGVRCHRQVASPAVGFWNIMVLGCDRNIGHICGAYGWDYWSTTDGYYSEPYQHAQPYRDVSRRAIGHGLRPR